MNSVQMGKRCVYAHVIDGVTLYVGKGYAQRPYEWRYRTQRWKDIIAGREFEVRILGWFDTDALASDFEHEKIKEFNPPANGQVAPHIKNQPRSATFKLKAMEADGKYEHGAKREAGIGFHKCQHCGYEWNSRVEEPKCCPFCKQRLNRKA